MRKEEYKNPSMPSEGTKKESHTPDKKKFGFVVAQTVTKFTPFPEIEKSINNFFEEMGGRLAKKCHIKKMDIKTRIHYNGRKIFRLGNIKEGAGEKNRQIRREEPIPLRGIEMVAWNKEKQSRKECGEDCRILDRRKFFRLSEKKSQKKDRKDEKAHGGGKIKAAAEISETVRVIRKRQDEIIAPELTVQNGAEKTDQKAIAPQILAALSPAE